MAVGNYILRLRSENEQLRARLEAAEMMLNEFVATLNGPKFNGLDLDGSRKDWISTTDVIREIGFIKAGLHTY